MTTPYALDITASHAMWRYVAERMVASKDPLTKADQAIGDGDHGIGMARGFSAVIEALDKQTFTTQDALLKTVGATLMATTGGAAGAIFGTLFRAAVKPLAGQTRFDADALAIWLNAGLAAVQARGNAKPGDKTMVDALAPAAAAAIGESLTAALAAAAAAAEQGVEQTKTMVATVGKAKTLGERSLGHADPGAMSMSLLLRFMNDYLTSH